MRKKFDLNAEMSAEKTVFALVFEIDGNNIYSEKALTK